MRPGFCWKNHQRGVGILGERPQDGLQRTGQTWREAGTHSHVAKTWNKDNHSQMRETFEYIFEYSNKIGLCLVGKYWDALYKQNLKGKLLVPVLRSRSNVKLQLNVFTV